MEPPSRATPSLAVRLGAAAAVAWLAAWWVGVQGWIQYPFALEWQEAAMFEHAARVAQGLPVYRQPSVDFTAFPYPPLFHWVGALFIGEEGGALSDLRSVSALSLLLALACLVLAGRRRAGLAAGLMGAGLFVAADGWTGTWTLIARVDSLALALTAASMLVGTSPRSLAGRPAWGAVAGLLGAAAVLAKQTALGPLAGLVVGLCARRGSRAAGLTAGAVAGVVLTGAVLALERSTDGWFGFHVFSVLAGSPLNRPAALGFLPDLLLAWAPLLVLTWLASRAPRGAPASEPMHPAEWCSLLALVVVAWVGRAHEGGYRNTLLPAALALAWAAGPIAARAATVRPRVAAALALALFPWLILSHPGAALPGEAEQTRLAELDQRLSAMEGQVWQPHGSLDGRGPGGVHAMAIADLLKSREREEAEAFFEDLSASLEERRFAAIVLGVELSVWASLDALTRNYRVEERLDSSAVAGQKPVVPPTGAPIGPRLLLVPR